MDPVPLLPWLLRLLSLSASAPAAASNSQIRLTAASSDDDNSRRCRRRSPPRSRSRKRGAAMRHRGGARKTCETRSESGVTERMASGSLPPELVLRQVGARPDHRSSTAAPRCPRMLAWRGLAACRGPAANPVRRPGSARSRRAVVTLKRNGNGARTRISRESLRSRPKRPSSGELIRKGGAPRRTRARRNACKETLRWSSVAAWSTSAPPTCPPAVRGSRAR
mmetsp:Transcript_122464/g.346265  ORF Transcript_122464/g.346265 Transcript_122464/m.346265 type:complete len:223 (+) Transcript_122464:110-778(+)